MELRKVHDELEARGISIVGLALEEEDAADTKKFLSAIGTGAPFPLLSDVGRNQTKGFEQTTVYLIDEEGIVRQVFPMQTYARGSVHAILREVDRVLE